MSRDALTFAWADVTWHGRHVTMTHDGTRVRARAKLGSQVMIGVSGHTIWGVSWSYTSLGSNWINILNPIQSSPLSYSTTSAHTHTHSWRGFLRSWDAGQRCCPPAPAWAWLWAWSRWSEGCCCLDHPAHPPEKVRPVRRISDRDIRRYSKLTSMLSFRGGTEIYDDYIIFWLSSYSWPPPFYILASD